MPLLAMRTVELVFEGSTFYPGDETAYLGFFESINEQQIASAFIEHLAGFARSLRSD